MNDEKQTKFESDLKAYFPHIWELHQLGKSDSQLWELVDALLEMRSQDKTGWVRIHYTQGRIDDVFQETSLLAYKKKRPGY